MRVETSRLVIDGIKAGDKENYFINISNDKAVLETFICKYVESLEEFDFTQYLGRDDLFAVREKETGELIGIFVLCAVDENDSAVEFGYGLGSRHWGKGYMTEALAAMISYFFENTAFRTIYASFFPENTASERVMKKCGMAFDRISEKELTYLGRERDLIYYKIEA